MPSACCRKPNHAADRADTGVLSAARRAVSRIMFPQKPAAAAVAFCVALLYAIPRPKSKDFRTDYVLCIIAICRKRQAGAYIIEVFAESDDGESFAEHSCCFLCCYTFYKRRVFGFWQSNGHVICHIFNAGRVTKCRNISKYSLVSQCWYFFSLARRTAKMQKPYIWLRILKKT